MAVLQFGDFRLDPVSKKLWRGDVEVELKGMPFAVLGYLAERGCEIDRMDRGGWLITKSDLQKYVWRDIHVSDETFRSCIRMIRRALDDDAHEPRYIKTQNKEGWRWIAPVTQAGAVETAKSSSLQPPDSPYTLGWYVERPQEEKEILSCVTYPGRPVVLYGPQGAGKGTLIARVLEWLTMEQSTERAPRILRISLRSFTETQLATLDAMLHELGQRMLDPCQEDDENTREVMTSAWSKKIDPQLKLKRLLQSQVLAEGRIVYLVLTDVDTLVAWRYQAAWFDMLRAWQDTEGLSSLRLILASAISPRLFPLSEHSPFWTKSARINVAALGEKQVEELARLHGRMPAPAACHALKELVGGLALLCRLAIFRAAMRGISIEELVRECQDSLQHGGVFNEHLSDLEQWVEHRSQGATKQWPQLLREAKTGVALTSEEAWPFLRKGLLRETEQRGVYRLRCKLYEDFFLGKRP